MSAPRRLSFATGATLSTAALVAAFACGGEDSTFSPTGDSGDTGGTGPSPVVRPEPLAIPALIQAEGFWGAKEANQSWDESDASCRNPLNTSVDVSLTADGGCVVGYTSSGEWLEYDVLVAETAAFDLVFRGTTGVEGSKLSISVDGEERGTVDVPEDGWETLSEFTFEGLNLLAGEHVIQIGFATGAANLDWIDFRDGGPCSDPCGERGCGENQCGESCGTCGDDETCTPDLLCFDTAECDASCGDKQCGLNVCGTSCGTCPGSTVCTPSGGCFDGSITPIARFGQLSVDGNQIVGADGEPVHLKGVSTQWLNWEQDYSTSQPALEFLRDNWALSVFRIANGVEGNNGFLEDPSRTDLVKAIIDNALETEVYVIVDWHTHEPDHLDEAIAFFSEIAATYGDEPNIIYEVFNEPLELDWSTELKPYHEAVIAAIREHDPDNLIVLGTPQWDQLPNVAIDDPVDDPNVAYTLHFYACSHGSGIRENGQAVLDAGMPIFVTEWGATHADGGTASNPDVCEGEARAWHEWMEANKVSWAAWKMSSDGDTSAFLKPSASVNGGWTEDDIHGHGFLVREFMMDGL